MRRLFVFGCSYTQWLWPTWADLLATDYDQFYNYGINGAGNRCIAERVSECLLSTDLTENDTIVVQWTDYHRFDFHQVGLQDKSNWACSGNIHINPKLPKLILDMWSEYSYIMHSLNFINLTSALLKNSNCRWHFTSSIDLTADLYQFDNLTRYKKVFELENWIPNIDSCVPRNTYNGIKMPAGWFSSRTQIQDMHPNTVHHRQWVEKYFTKTTSYLDYDDAFSKIENNKLEYSDIDWKKINKDNVWDQHEHYILGL